MKVSLYTSLCNELANCLFKRDLDKFDDVYEIAMKSDPEHFSKKNRYLADLHILQIYNDKLNMDVI